jgi:hypothetical protein
MKKSKAFISYTHDNDSHMSRVLELSERLRSDGVDSNLDQYEFSPPEGWPAWMRKQIKQADFVLVICTENYLRRYEGLEEPGKGAGAKWEGAIITQELYEAEGRNTKFIPIVFTHDDVKNIPVEMRAGTHYLLDSDARYDDLYAHLTDQPRTVKSDLGELRPLPPIKAGGSVVSVRTDAPQEPNPLVPHESLKSELPLVLLLQPGGNALFVRAQRIRAHGKMITLSLLPSDPRQIAAITEFERNTRDPIGLAYNQNALFVKLKSIEQVIEKEEVWHLELEEDEYATRGGSFGFNMASYSTDEIAEMRARRILLDEKLDLRFGGKGDLNRQLLETSVQGGYDSKLAIAGSPLPGLYSGFRGQAPEFTEAARLYAFLLLLLTHTVSQVLRLDLEMQSDGTLAVSFEGTRPPRYSNEEPHVIQVEGTCKLN